MYLERLLEKLVQVLVSKYESSIRKKVQWDVYDTIWCASEGKFINNSNVTEMDEEWVRGVMKQRQHLEVTA